MTWQIFSLAISWCLVTAAGCSLGAGPSSQAGTSAQGTQPPPLAEIRFGIGSENYGWMPALIARDKGFFERENLRVEIINLRAEAMLPAILAQEVHIVSHSPDPFIAAVHKGAPLVLIGSMFDTTPYDLVAQKDINQVSELRGKRVGLLSPATVGTILTREMLRERYGLVAGTDFDVINTGSSTATVSQIESGAIAAGIIIPPTSYQLRDKGFKILTNTSGFMDVPVAALATTTEYAANHRDVVVRFLKAWLASLEWIHSNREGVVQYSMEKHKLSREHALEAYDTYMKYSAWPRDGKIRRKGFEALMGLMVSLKAIDNVMPFERLVDPSYLDEAQRRMTER